mgnify:CR=1 FL=1
MHELETEEPKDPFSEALARMTLSEFLAKFAGCADPEFVARFLFKVIHRDR